MVKVLHIVSNLYQNAGQAAWLIAGLKKFPQKNWVHKVAFVNPDPDQPNRSEELKAMGIESVVYDPCAGEPSQEDFISSMRINLEALRKVFGDS